MNRNIPRPCPLCGGAAGNACFPYATRFNGVSFSYLQCRSCRSTFVDPVPDAGTFAKMYAKSAYHDAHYAECESPHYRESAVLLKDFLPAGASVLDYGCGLGLFLRALKEQGFSAMGVEFDREAAESASSASGCPAFALEDFAAYKGEASVDALHLGDVLEHLADPGKTLQELLTFVKPQGLLFVEGPLENNPSPVFWAAQLFGRAKKLLKPGLAGSTAPTHLLRVDAAQQVAFFRRFWPELETLHWSVYETGWPYRDGGAVKSAIAGLATAAGGKNLFGVTFGNRFRGVFRLPKAPAQGQKA
ncbi:MAG TPA: class I SAM-dependent methyltransferase [Hyphomicrobium sp.]|jgi:2-polyprenyl-3-methyl-5-hydroxy-6-metoxy-1,4-benzoquinol methylase